MITVRQKHDDEHHQPNATTQPQAGDDKSAKDTGEILKHPNYSFLEPAGVNILRFGLDILRFGLDIVRPAGFLFYVPFEKPEQQI